MIEDGHPFVYWNNLLVDGYGDQLSSCNDENGVDPP